MKKVYINPKVPEWMDSKALEKRSKSHMDKWFNRAYIRTEKFFEDDYKDYSERCKENIELETEEQFNNRIAKQKKEWFGLWPEGIRYDVKCLDGGAWDRTTNKGSYKTLEEAIAHCKVVMKELE